MGYRIALIPGDGIGRDVAPQGVTILEAVEEAFGISFDVTEIPGGGQYYLEHGEEWPDGSFETCKDSDAILLAAVGYPGSRLPNGDLAGGGIVFGLRFGLDLYANVRPTKLYPNVPHKIHNEFVNVWKEGLVDFLIVRENTEGLYSPTRGFLRRGGQEDLAIDARVITRKGSARVIRYAFEIAKKRSGAPKDGVSRVTCVDKSNVTAGCQLFRRVYDEVAEDYPDIERDHAYIDAFTQWIVRNPDFYDVAVAPNMFGDIATDLAAVLQGGMGMAASGNIGDEHALFEPVHGSAPRHAGKDKANPTATILAVQMMLEWLGERKGDARLVKASEAVEAAVEAHLKDGKQLTYDLGGTASCSEVGSAIAGRLTA